MSSHTQRTPRRVQGSPGAWRDAHHQPPRRQERAVRTPAEILEAHLPGQTHPLRVLDLLIEFHNTQHTALEKTVSHKTRQERADFLRRFFRDIKAKAHFATMPDPRNLGERHVRAMVAVWQKERLAPQPSRPTSVSCAASPAGWASQGLSANLLTTD